MSRKPTTGWHVWLAAEDRESFGRRVEVRDGEHIYVRRAPRARSARVALADFLLDTDYSDETRRVKVRCVIIGAGGYMIDRASAVIGAAR